MAYDIAKRSLTTLMEPEFLRQNALLANIWTGLGAKMTEVIEPDRHHFTIVDGLASADHPLTRALLAENPG